MLSRVILRCKCGTITEKMDVQIRSRSTHTITVFTVAKQTVNKEFEYQLSKDIKEYRMNQTIH